MIGFNLLGDLEVLKEKVALLEPANQQMKTAMARQATADHSFKIAQH